MIQNFTSSLQMETIEYETRLEKLNKTIKNKNELLKTKRI